MFKDALTALSESAELDKVEIGDIDGEIDTYEDIDDIYASCEQLDDDIEYVEEMVTVIEQSLPLGRERYLVDHSSLLNFMESAKISTVEAINRVCEANNIPAEHTCLLVESYDNFMQSINEACCANKKCKSLDVKKKASAKVKKAAKELKDLKKNGIKIIRKKNK